MMHGGFAVFHVNVVVQLGAHADLLDCKALETGCELEVRHPGCLTVGVASDGVLDKVLTTDVLEELNMCGEHERVQVAV